ncbi:MULTISPECIES: hypothetical protein [unclassified Synechococcus]|uniref:hypothetical protein n=1 Tax=unclassified Synechococcus TaxID=2626047 RepID=UPI0020CD4AB0|nr:MULTISPECIES: hypothetical protein [unclassified Synechococcus]
MPRPLRWVVALLLAAGLLVGGVLLLPFADWLPGGTVADVPLQQVVNGSRFNRLFPRSNPELRVTMSQEKRGFSEARLKQGDQVIALLAISDTITAPEARAKFEQAEERLKGWPLVEQGPHASALLVADRFQVKVIEHGSSLDAAHRHGVLENFDLQGLAALGSSPLPRS